MSSFRTAKANHIFFFRKILQHISVSLNVNFDESLTNDIVSFEQLDPGYIKLKLFDLLKTRAVVGERARLLGTFYIVTFLSLSHII